MSDQNPSDPFDSHAESSGCSNDDFEQLDAPGSVFYNQYHDSGDADGPEEVGSSGAFDYDLEQDTQVSTTTANLLEDEAEEDRYASGASEADAYTRTAEPLISFDGDEYNNYAYEPQEDDPIQPSAPVPDLESANDFASSTAADILSTITPSAYPPAGHYREPISSTSYDDYEFNDEPEIEKVPTTLVKNVLEDAIEETARAACFLRGLDPRVKDLIYWRDVKKTGVVFGSLLVILLSLALMSVISVVAYISLAVLALTFSFVTYKKVMNAVQKSGDGHPFKCILEKDIGLNEERLRSIIQTILKNVNATAKELRHLFLIEDIVDSVKFGILLWALTYIGSWFSDMALIIIALVLVFSVPKLYETYQVQIDNCIHVAKAQINNYLSIIQSKVPFLKKKEKTQ
ncbi:unnamed protein product [Candidula unifasciata]|uniref:Reticulon-like protein n=1 Tax=Candidula unifasciata TaxID=100452 RepID=A0A8S3Z1N8_9EUPU|nr:unnamed protein product [Candidula unifasciata]